METSSQIVSITFFQYRGWRQRWWAFRQMGQAHASLSTVRGLHFYKMLGTGAGNGFSISPNWSQYALLCVWDDEGNAEDFQGSHSLFGELCQRSESHWTVRMRTAMVHGQWEGQQPFQVNAANMHDDAPVAVITRATIRTSRLLHFWRNVPSVSSSMNGSPGLLFSVGIGELPLIQQATFSLWRSVGDMKAYAYRSKAHSEVIRKTRALNWYKEELFARFIPFNIDGASPELVSEFTKTNK